VGYTSGAIGFEQLMDSIDQILRAILSCIVVCNLTDNGYTLIRNENAIRIVDIKTQNIDAIVAEWTGNHSSQFDVPC
jgi:hypothetical protein